VLAGRGLVLTGMGRMADAEQDAIKALALDPVRGAIGWKVRAFARLEAEDFAAAVEHASRFLERAPEDATCLFVRGFARSRLGQTDAARADLKAALAGRLNRSYRSTAIEVLRQLGE
jgi:Flp pilus assembly protein TadD